MDAPSAPAAALSQGIAAGWFTGAQAAFIDPAGVRLVCAGGESQGGSAITGSTLFDLASLTKPLVTLAAAGLVADGSLDLGRRVGELLPETAGRPIGGIRLVDLLAHRSGLPAYRSWEEEFAGAEDDEVRRRIIAGEGKAFARERLLQLVPDPDSGPVYSDIGFFLLQVLLEEGLGARMPGLLNGARFTGGTGLRYAPASAPLAGAAGTGWSPWRRRTLIGEVNDPRAYLVGGIAAWAGLFATAATLAEISARVMDSWRGTGPIPAAVRLLAAGDEASRRAGFGYGFWRPDPGRSLGGSAIPATAFGHVGFTGTSWWLDPPSGRAVILLTNLLLPREGRGPFNSWRRDLHDLFWKER